MSDRDSLTVVAGMQLPQEHYAIFGSGPLLVRGIIDEAQDVDIICRGPVWERVRSEGQLRYLEQHDVTVASLFEGRVTFGTRWAIGDFDVDLLIDTAERISGLPFVRLEHVIEYKRIANRSKDIVHLDAVRRYLEGAKEA